MSAPRVIYEVHLAHSGRTLTSCGLLTLPPCLVGGILCLRYEEIPLLIMIILLFIFFVFVIVDGFRRRKNAGYYRICLDDYGLYVHSDAPKSVPSFTVLAPEIERLVHKITDNDGSKTHEYYIETKSGKRYQIGNPLNYLNFNGLDMFDQITDCFHWLEIEEEETVVG